MMSRKVICMCMLIVTLISTQANLQLDKMKVDNSKPGNPFVDHTGRVRTFHGINQVEKRFPWYPALLLNQSHVDQISSWGFNVIRLGMMWSGVEIASFKLNETYLSIMDNIISSLAKKGIYVILDMHQDALSARFNTYDGAPKWLIDSFPPPKHAYPYPFKNTPTNFNFDYITTACGEAFENLYNNDSRSLDHLGFFWHTVASRYGRYNNVLGYEIINEPWPGNVLSSPSLFIPGHAGSKVLQPLYDTISKFIRSADEQTIIFYEPVTWGMILHGNELGTGFTHVPGGDDYKDRSVLSFHYYCWFAGTDNQNPFPAWLRTLCDKIFFPRVVNSIHKDIKDTGGGAFLTEFGLCQATAPHNSTEYQECLSVLHTADVATLSWTYWDSEFYHPDGSVITENVKLFSRTYAMAVAGQPIESSFDSVAGTFMLFYISDPSIKTPTVIFASPMHYPNGFTVTVTNSTYSVVDTNYIEVTSSSQTSQIIKIIVVGKQ